MDDKVPTLIGYVVLGVVFACAPILASLLSLRSSKSKRSRFRGTVLAVIAVGVTIACLTTVHIGIPAIFVIAAASVAATWSNRKIDWSSSVAMALAFGVSTTLLWWKRVMVADELNVSLPLLGIAFALCAAFARAFIDPPITKPRKSGLSEVSTVCALLVLAAFFSFSTSVYQSPTIVSSAWHHWGVYIGPAQLARAGALLMRDVPMQYGLGLQR